MSAALSITQHELTSAVRNELDRTVEAHSSAHAARPIAQARATFADALNGWMTEHVASGAEVCSNASVARICGITESIVRRWRKGEVPMPAGALLLIPERLFQNAVEHLVLARANRNPR